MSLGSIMTGVNLDMTCKSQGFDIKMAVWLDGDYISATVISLAEPQWTTG